VTFAIRHTGESDDIIDELDRQLIGFIAHGPEDEAWLVTRNDGTPAGFATGKITDGWFYLTSCGVIPEARGQGLQRRLITTYEKWARKQCALGAYTYTLPFNVASGNNLISAGYKLWRPAVPWAGVESVYWRKAFK
jgi:GNAT superfamily N-acetyltransferase